MPTPRMSRLRLMPLAAFTLLALAAQALAGPRVGFLKVQGPLDEREQSLPFFLASPDKLSLPALLEELDACAKDPDMKGLVLRLSDPGLTMTKVEEIGAAITRVRAAGKKVHVFTEVYEQPEVMLGSFADEVIVQTGGSVMLPGIYAEEMFLKDALSVVGVKPDFIQIGAYKGASEMMNNSAPSPEWDQNINQLLDSMYTNMKSMVGAGRHLSDAQVEKAMALSMFLDADDAKKLGLVDTVLDRAELDQHLAQSYGKDFEYLTSMTGSSSEPDLASMGLFEVFAQVMSSMKESSRTTTRDTIAVLHIDGSIVDGKSSRGGLMGGSSVGSLTIREALADIEEDPNVRGVIVRINSPGGSAIASEIIWNGLRRVAKTKPVWASVGSMAASGGYYIAVGADRIYANPSSIVGSIGVVGGKLAMQGLYDMLDINVVPRARGPMASAMSSLAPWDATQREMVTRDMQRVYDQFVGRVTGGRKGIDISKTAEGRLFTGNKALDLNMIDKVGGLEATVSDFASALKLSEGEYDLLEYPAPPSLEEMFQGGFPLGKASAASPAIAALREAVGDNAWETVARAVSAMLELRREPVLLTSPNVLIFR